MIIKLSNKESALKSVNITIADVGHFKKLKIPRVLDIDLKGKSLSWLQKTLDSFIKESPVKKTYYRILHSNINILVNYSLNAKELFDFQEIVDKHGIDIVNHVISDFKSDSCYEPYDELLIFDDNYELLTWGAYDYTSFDSYDGKTPNISFLERYLPEILPYKLHRFFNRELFLNNLKGDDNYDVIFFEKGKRIIAYLNKYKEYKYTILK